jgi:hypothetical protein
MRTIRDCLIELRLPLGRKRFISLLDCRYGVRCNVKFAVVPNYFFGSEQQQTQASATQANVRRCTTNGDQTLGGVGAAQSKFRGEGESALCLISVLIGTE